MIEIYICGVLYDTTNDELIAGALKKSLEGIGWKNITIKKG